MQYKSIIEPNQDGLKEVIDLLMKIEEDKVVAAILNRRFTHDDIAEYTSQLTEKRARLQRELESLKKFSRTFNKQYATDNNKCFSTAQRMFNIIRSNLKETKGAFKKFCMRRAGRGPIVDGEETQLPAMTHSLLSDIPYANDLFGIDTFSEPVKLFIKELLGFFQDVQDALELCDAVLEEEGLIRQDAAKCLRLYQECSDDVVSSSREFIKYFGEEGFRKIDEVSEEMNRMPSFQDFVTDHLHIYNRNQFTIHVLHKTYTQGRADNMTDIETFLWPRDAERVFRIREVLRHFDELDPQGQYIKSREVYKLSGKHVAAFMEWCGVKDTQKEKKFVEQYFNKNYDGCHLTIASSTVNSAKNKFLRDDGEKRQIISRIEALAEKYCS